MAALKKGLSACGMEVVKPITGVPSHLLSPPQPNMTSPAIYKETRGLLATLTGNGNGTALVTNGYVRKQ
jgi:hypothetical protein